MMRTNAESVVIVETLNDIKRVIQEFVPGSQQQNPEVHATIVAENKTYELSAPTGCAYRDMLIGGFNIIKKRSEIDEQRKEVETHLNINPINISGHMWLDDLISRRLAGTRDGLRVKWEIEEGTFFFDPFTGKLSKCTA